MPHAGDDIFLDHLASLGVAPDAMGIAPNAVSSGGIFRRAVQRTPLVNEILRVARVDSPVTAAVPDRKRRPWAGLEAAQSLTAPLQRGKAKPLPDDRAPS